MDAEHAQTLSQNPATIEAKMHLEKSRMTSVFSSPEDQAQAPVVAEPVRSCHAGFEPKRVRGPLAK
eukprot:UC1_evm1s1260